MLLISSFIKKYDINRDFILFTLVALSACYLYYDRVYMMKQKMLASQNNAVLKLEEEIASLTEAGGALEDKGERLKALEKEYDKLNKEKDRLFSKFPDNAEASKMLKDIVSEKKFSAINFESYYPSDEVPTGNGYSYIPIEVKISGSFNKMGEYIKYIENLPRIIIIDNIAFQATEINDRITTSSAKLEGRTYVLNY